MFEEVEHCKQIMKNRFKKGLIMTEVNERNFQISDKCYICDKLHDLKDSKVTGHCNLTGKYEVTFNRICNVNFEMTNKIPVLFHSLIGHEGHHIM